MQVCRQETFKWQGANAVAQVFYRSGFLMAGLGFLQDESSSTDYWIAVFDSNEDGANVDLKTGQLIDVIFVPAGDQSRVAWIPPLDVKYGLRCLAFTAFSFTALTGTPAAPDFLVTVTRVEEK